MIEKSAQWQLIEDRIFRRIKREFPEICNDILVGYYGSAEIDLTLLSNARPHESEILNFMKATYGEFKIQIF